MGRNATLQEQGAVVARARELVRFARTQGYRPDELARLIEEVMDEAGLALGDFDAIAVTAGPGLIGGVMVGLVTAKALAKATAITPLLRLSMP